MALEAGHLDSEEFLPGRGVPDADVLRTAGEYVRVVMREAHVVDFLGVAGVA